MLLDCSISFIHLAFGNYLEYATQMLTGHTCCMWHVSSAHCYSVFNLWCSMLNQPRPQAAATIFAIAFGQHLPPSGLYGLDNQQTLLRIYPNATISAIGSNHTGVLQAQQLSVVDALNQILYFIGGSLAQSGTSTQFRIEAGCMLPSTSLLTIGVARHSMQLTPPIAAPFCWLHSA